MLHVDRTCAQTSESSSTTSRLLTLTLLETCWRLRGPSGRVLTCAVYRIAAPGVEVRVGYSDDDVVRTQLVAEIGVARDLAEE